MKLASRAILLIAMTCICARAQTPPTPAQLSANASEVTRGLSQLYEGDADGATEVFRAIQRAHPAHPLGYLLEANAAWWKIYCAACEIKWNMIDAWKRGKLPEDDRFFALADKGITLAEYEIARRESAEMHFYAGMGYALRARLHGLRDEKRATARNGVRAREHFLRVVELEPNFADAYTGLGLYNYYVDALSGIAKVLRFFMGIPGGSKKEGMQQLEKAIAGGKLTSVEARFYLAKSVRNYEQNYQRGLELMRPLVERYPRNAVFHLLLGDLHGKLGHHAEAAASFRAAQQLALADKQCSARVSQITQQAIAALPPPTTATSK